MSLSFAQIWMAIGLVLIAAEITSMTFFLLWPSVAAFCVALVTWVFPEFALIGQLLLFSIISTVLLATGRKLVLPFSRKNMPSSLNDKMAQMIGQNVTVVAIDGENLRVKFGDSEWSAKSYDPFALGETGKIAEYSGNVLIIEK